jgi:uncharacterized membrane protein
MRPRPVYALCGCLLLLQATRAHASGDPIVIYVTAGGGIAQVALLVFILAARAFRSARFPAVAAYLLYLVVLWAWAWQSKQSAMMLGAGLVVLPCLIIGALLWMLAKADRRLDAAV